MFFARTSTSSEWKAVAAAIKTLVEEATFEATPEALIFRAMDPSHIALVDLFWPNTAFEKYECDKQFRFSLRVEDFVKLFNRCEAKDSVEISHTEDAIQVKFENAYRRVFTIHLIESSTATAPLPKLDFDAKIEMNKNTFEKILNDVSVVSDQVTVHAQPDKVIFSGKSDVGQVSIQLDKVAEGELEINVKNESRATYSVDYLLSITKAINLAEYLVCELSTKKPLRLEFRLNEHGSRIHYYLAPRIGE